MTSDLSPFVVGKLLDRSGAVRKSKSIVPTRVAQRSHALRGGRHVRHHGAPPAATKHVLRRERRARRRSHRGARPAAILDQPMAPRSGSRRSRARSEWRSRTIACRSTSTVARRCRSGGRSCCARWRPSIRIPPATRSRFRSCKASSPWLISVACRHARNPRLRADAALPAGADVEVHARARSRRSAARAGAHRQHRPGVRPGRASGHAASPARRDGRCAGKAAGSRGDLSRSAFTGDPARRRRGSRRPCRAWRSAAKHRGCARRRPRRGRAGTSRALGFRCLAGRGRSPTRPGRSSVRRSRRASRSR